LGTPEDRQQTSRVPQLDDRRLKLKEEYVAKRGHWPEQLNAVLLVDPDFLESFIDFNQAILVKKANDAKTRELIYLAINASTTHLYKRGMKNHMRRALQLGATVDEILEVLEIVVGIGMHSTAEGAPLLLEVLNESKSKSDEGAG
jgi:alkylhydroperoxidase/carboxymuconolactone decarboxylase family protein YurZ